MTSTKPASPVQPAEQQRYAAMLGYGTRLGLVMLVLSFAAYISGLVEAHVPPEELPRLWQQPVDRYLELTQSPTGWDWLAMIHRSDMAGLAAVAILAGCSLPCLLSLVPLYAARRDRVFVAICLAEVAVVTLAASGWLTGGH
jgi:hypothetical protein